MRKLSRAEAIAAHSKLLKETMTFLGEVKASIGRYFRHEQGEGWFRQNKNMDERYLKYGLTVGMSDIVGITAVEITPEMVGKKIGVFTCYEIKTGEAVQSVEQKNLQKMIERFGGIYKVIRNKEDVL